MRARLGLLGAATALLALSAPMAADAGATGQPGGRADARFQSQSSLINAFRDRDVSSLARGLLDPDREVRKVAAWSLAQLGPEALPARSSLRRALGDEDTHVRAWAAIGLGRMGDGDDATLRGLLEAIEQASGRSVHTCTSVGCARLGEAVEALERSGGLLARLGTTGCYGTCPIYSIYVLRDGQTLYVGTRFVKVEGFRSKRLAAAELDALVGAFREAGYFSLADRYPPSATCSPSVNLWFSNGGLTKKIEHDLSNPGPVSLRQLEKRFDEIVGSAEWVGTRDERSALSR